MIVNSYQPDAFLTPQSSVPGNVWIPLESERNKHSKVQLLMRDIASTRERGKLEGNKWVVGAKWLCYPLGFMGSRQLPHATWPCQQTHIPPVHNHNISRHNNIPMIHALFFLPCIHPFMFHIFMSFLLLFGLHSLPIQPLWLRSILIGCSTHLMFSKKHPYWMVLMSVYMEMAEGLVEPLVILPAAVMPLTTFILIFSQHHRPLYSCWFIPSNDPLHPRFTL